MTQPSKKSKALGRLLKNKDTSSYAEDFKKLDERYDVPGYRLASQVKNGEGYANLTRPPWKSMFACELFVRILFTIHEDLANIYLITQDLSATVAVCRVLDGKIDGFPPANSIIPEIEKWYAVVVDGEGTKGKQYPWIASTIATVRNEARYINGGNAMDERFEKVRQDWYFYFDKACEAAVERIKTEEDPKYLVEAFRVISNEFAEMLDAYSKIENAI